MSHPALSRRTLLLRARSSRLILAASVGALLASAAVSPAATNVYKGGANWNLTTAWSPGHVPTTTDALFFDHSIINPMVSSQLNASFTAQTLAFNTGTDVFGIDANTSGTTAQTLTLTGGTNANGGTDLISLSATTTGTITLGGTAGVGTLTVAFGAVTGTINVANATATLVFGANSLITGTAGLTADGAGTLKILSSDSYTGVTTISAGVLSVATLANGGTASGIGSSTNVAANLVLNGGTLQDTGAAQSTDRLFTVGTSGGTLDASGSGLLTFANTGAMVLSGTNTARTFTLAGSGSGSFSPVIGDDGAGPTTLGKTGVGSWTLQGANTYTGGTNLNGGTLSLGSSGALGTTSSISFGGGTLQFTAANTTDYSARFSNAASQAYSIDTNGQTVTLATALTSSGGSLTKLGNGTLTLSGTNTYSGPTTINGGTLSLGSSGALGSAGPIVFGGGTLQYTAANTTDYSSRFSVAPSQAYSIDTNGQIVTFGTDITSAGPSLTKLGDGTLVLTTSVNGTYSGTTTISGGALQVGDGSFTGAIINNANLTVAPDPAGLTFVSGVISGSGSVTVTGGGPYAPGFANTYTGPTTVRNSTLSVSNEGQPGTVFGNGGQPGFLGASSNAAANLVLDGATVAVLAAQPNLTTDRLFTVGPNGVTFDDRGDNGGLDFTNTGAIAFSGTNTSPTITFISDKDLNPALYSKSSIFAPSIGDNGTGHTAVTFMGGDWFLTGNNTYSGATTLPATGDRLIIEGNNVLPGALIDNGSIELVGGISVSVGSVTGTGSIDFGAAGSTLTTGSDNTSTTFSGTIINSGTIIKTGSGTWTLTGANPYTDGIFLHAGTLSLGSSGALGSTGPITFTGGTLQYTAASASMDYSSRITGSTSPISIDTNGQMVTFASVLGSGNSGGLTKLGAGTLNIAAAASYTGNTSVSAGTLLVSGGGSVSTNGTVTVQSGTTLTVDGAGSSLSSGSVSIGSNGSAALNLQNGGAVNSTFLNLFAAGSLNIGGATAGQATGGTLNAAPTVTGTSGSTVNFNQSDPSYTFAGQITGAVAVHVNGPGTTVFPTPNSYTGTTTIASGSTLDLLTGTSGTGGGNLVDNGTLAFSSSGAVSFAHVISGSGSVQQNGPGTLTLSDSSANTYSGGTTIATGTTLIFTVSASAGTGAVVDNGTLVLNSGATFSNISGSGGVQKSGGGAATLTGTNSYTGQTTVTGVGELIIAGPVSGTSGVTVDTGGSLLLESNLSVGSITVGVTGAATLGIGNGVLSTSQAIIGSAPGANGSATLAGAWNNTGDLYVGNNGGTGTLNFNAGTLNVGGTIYVGANGGTGILNANTQLHQFGAAAIGIAGGNGTMTIGSGTWNGGFSADVGDGGTGTFTITGGAFVVGASTYVGANGGNGTMTVNGGARWNGNGLYIGLSNGTGVLNIQNGATVTDAEVNGITGAIFQGQLSATLLGNGTLNIGAFGGGTTAGTLIALEVIGSGASVVNFNQTNGSYTFAPAIIGTIVVNQNSPGTTILTGANTYSGGTNLNAGTLNLGSSTALGTGGTITFAGGTLQFSAANATDYSASFSTAANQAYSLDTNGQNVTLATALTSAGGTLTKNGAGLLILTGANTYTGATTIGGDTLQLGNGGTTGSLSASSGITDNGNLVFNRADTLVQGTDFGTISGSGSITQAGAGTTVLTAANSYTGGTNLNGGTLSLDSSGALGATGAISFGGGTLQFTAANTTDYSALFSTADGQAYSIDTNGQNVTLATALTSSGGSLTKLGAGTLLLSAANTFSGGTTIFAGTLPVGGASTTSGSGSAMTILDGTTGTGLVTVNGGTLDLGAFNLAVGGLSGSGGTIASSSTSTAGSLTIVTNGTTSYAGTIADNTGSGSTPVSVTVAGSGTQILSGMNTYTGGTNLTSGTLSLGSSGALGTAGAISFGGGTLQFSAANTTDYSARFSTAAGQAYSIDTNGQNVSFATALISSGGALTKLGAGTLVLTGASHYTGPTTILGGALEVDGSLTGSATTVNNGATLAGRGTVAGAVNVLAGGSLNPGSAATIGTLSVGRLILNDGASANFRLTQPGTVGGGINDLVSVTSDLTLGGILNLTVTNGGSYPLFTYGGTLTNNGFSAINTPLGYSASLFTGTAHEVDVMVTALGITWDGNGAAGDGVVTGGNGTWDNTTGNWTIPSGLTNGAWNGSVALFGTVGGTVTLGSAISASGLTFATDGYILNGGGFALTLTSAAALAVNNAADVATINAPISGSAGLNYSGAGTLILGSAANTYTGATTVSTGTVQIGTAGNASALSSSPIAITNGGTLAVLNLNGGTLANNISNGVGGVGTVNFTSATPVVVSGNLTDGTIGQLALTQSGLGTTTITGTSNTYTGPTKVTKGTLAVTGKITGGNISVGAGATLAVSGTGNVSPGSSKTLLVDGTSGSPANVTLANAATLATGAATVGATGPGSITQNGGSFTTNGSTLFLGTSATGSGAYTLNSGTLTTGAILGQAGTSTFNFNGGTLHAGISTTDFFESLTTANVQAGGALIDTGAFNVTVAQSLLHDTTSGAPANDGGLTKAGAGTLALTGTNTFTGPVTVNAGTLSVPTEASLGAAAGTVFMNGNSQLLFTSSASLSKTYSLGVATLAPAGGNTLTYAGATIFNGTLGAGSHLLADGASFNGTRTTTGTVLSQSSGTATLNNVTLSGNTTFTQAAGATVNSTGDFITTANTAMTIGGTFNTTGATVTGALHVASGGTLNQSGSNTPLYLDGSRGTVVDAGGQINAAAGSTIELGGLLVNNGTQTGVLDVNLGAVAKGSGIFDTVHVGSGGKFSPGNSPGTATVNSLSFDSGGIYQFELTSATAANDNPGSSADLIHDLGTLNLTAGTTSSTRFTIQIVTLDSDDNPAALTDFNSSQPYTFVLATTNGITGFNPNAFTVDSSGFANNLNGGAFAVTQAGNNIDLTFAPTPEPSALVSLLGGAAVLLGWRRRRRS